MTSGTYAPELRERREAHPRGTGPAGGREPLTVAYEEVTTGA